MNKKDIKYIREIANRLPQVFEQTVSGYYEDYNEEGEIVLYPNIQNNPINHERRLRKAYEQLGMDGIKSYLEMIHKLQIQRNENVQKLLDTERQEQVLHDMVPSTEDRPSTVSDDSEASVQGK